MIKVTCDKGFIWNPSNCDCECDKSCDVGEYLDYEICKCRKKLVENLIERSSDEQCIENIDEVKIAEMAFFEHGNECVSSHTICVILAVIALTISIGIGACFTYKYMNHWYLKRYISRVIVLSLLPVLKHQFNKLINGKSQTSRDQKSNLTFLQRHN